jgi:perosamine synthetase
MTQVRLMKPSIRFDEVEADFREVFDSGIFTRGNNVDAFRKDLAAYTGSKHAFLFTSATTALWMCLKLLKVGPGDEVAVSDFSFPATANVVEDLGAKPVFVDVDLETYNMRSDALISAITDKTKAVIFVDALGNPTGLLDIKRICEERGIPLIEDAACAIGSAENGRQVGSVADMTCFSFHPRKLISTGEGGAITTDRDDWADWFDVKLAHGAKGFKGPGLDFVDFGYNFRLPELQAIMGRKQLAKIEQIVDQRNSIRNAYISELTPLGFKPQHAADGVRYNVQSLVFLVPEGIARNALINALKERGVESTIGTYSLSNSTFYETKYHEGQPGSGFLEANTITLPCFEGIDVAHVVSEITKAVAEIRRAVPA